MNSHDGNHLHLRHQLRGGRELQYFHDKGADEADAVVAADVAVVVATVETTTTTTSTTAVATEAAAVDNGAAWQDIGSILAGGSSATTAAPVVQPIASEVGQTDEVPNEVTTATEEPEEETPEHHKEPHEDAEVPSDLLTDSNQQEEDNADTDENAEVAQALAEKQAYENKFSMEIVTPQTSTTTLFANPDAFSLVSIHASPHFLTNKLQGRMWLDANGDGRRGDYNDPTVNAMEYDVGVGGVKVQLVNCATDEIVDSSGSISQPVPLNEFGVGGGAIEDRGAGVYSFDTDSLPSGRYYFMYQAPANYRLSGNILPLKSDTKPKSVDDNFNCVPAGGEGEAYARQALEVGDLDNGGYCARSVGCMEIGAGPYPPIENGSSFQPYKDITLLQDEIIETGLQKLDDYYASWENNLVAMPSRIYSNVGLAREEWPLGTYQYAEGQITLSFPSSGDSSLIEAAVPKDFEKSPVRQDLEEVLTEFLGDMFGDGGDEEGSQSGFALKGVNLHAGKILGSQTQASSSRMLLRGTSVATASTRKLSEQLQLEYTFTTRGSYRPPPFHQLGQIVEDSINRDPEGLVRSLKEKESLPQVFDEVEGIEARHLTVKSVRSAKMKKPQVMNVLSDGDEAGMDSWAVISVCLLASFIVVLAGMFLYRRAFVRRVRPDPTGSITKYVKGSINEGTLESTKEDKDEEQGRGDNDDDDDDPLGTLSLTVSMLKQELESYGVSTEGFLEKSEMLQALEKARKDKEKRMERRRKKKKQRSADGSGTSGSSSSCNNQGASMSSSFATRMNDVHASSPSDERQASPESEIDYNTPEQRARREERRRKKKKKRPTAGGLGSSMVQAFDRVRNGTSSSSVRPNNQGSSTSSSSNTANNDVDARSPSAERQASADRGLADDLERLARKDEEKRRRRSKKKRSTAGSLGSSMVEAYERVRNKDGKKKKKKRPSERRPRESGES